MKKLLVGLAAAAASVMSSSAAAQAYASVATGKGEIKVNCAGADTCDRRDDPAYRFIAGHRFANGLAVELGITDYGTASYASAGTSATFMTNGFSAGVAFDAPLGSWLGLSARAGVTRLKTELQAWVGPWSVYQSDTTTAPYVGLGLYVMPWRNIRVEAGVDVSRAALNGEKIDVRAVLMGVRVLF